MQITFPILIALQVLNGVTSFRDYPAHYSSDATLTSKKSSSNHSVYERSFQNVLSRNKRSFVFCPGTYAIITHVSAKGLLGGTPRALYASYENDIFYDMPVLVEGWRQPWDNMLYRMYANMKKEDVALDETYDNIHVGVVNASAIPLDEYNKLPLRQPNWNTYSSNYQTYRKNLWNPNRYTQRRYRPSDRGSSSSEYNYQNSQRRNYAPYRRQQRSDSGEKLPLWYHHREYRERRGFYDYIEAFGKMIGKNLRQCVLRMICEMKQSLLPSGQSLINDVARILFTVPTDHDDQEDDFTKMAKEDNVDCARRFMVSCPHSPLEYVFTNFRANGEPPEKPPTNEDVIQSIIYA